MAKQSLAMMVFMAMVSEGYAVRVGAKTDAQAALLTALDSKFEDKKREQAASFKFIDLKPLEKLINGLKNAETLNEGQVDMLQNMAKHLKVDHKVIGAVSSEVSKSEMVLDAIKSQLPGHQSSPVVLSYRKTIRLFEIETVVESGELADLILQRVTDKASAKSLVADLLEEAEENAALESQRSARQTRSEVAKCQKSFLDAIEWHRDQSSQSGDGATVGSDTKTTVLSEIETKVRKGEFHLLPDEASAKTFVAYLLEEAEKNAAMKQLSAHRKHVNDDKSNTCDGHLVDIAVDLDIDSTQTVAEFDFEAIRSHEKLMKTLNGTQESTQSNHK